MLIERADAKPQLQTNVMKGWDEKLVETQVGWLTWAACHWVQTNAMCSNMNCIIPFSCPMKYGSSHIPNQNKISSTSWVTFYFGFRDVDRTCWCQTSTAEHTHLFDRGEMRSDHSSCLASLPLPLRQAYVPFRCACFPTFEQVNLRGLDSCVLMRLLSGQLICWVGLWRNSFNPGHQPQFLFRRAYGADYEVRVMVARFALYQARLRTLVVSENHNPPALDMLAEGVQSHCYCQAFKLENHRLLFFSLEFGHQSWGDFFTKTTQTLPHRVKDQATHAWVTRGFERRVHINAHPIQRIHIHGSGGVLCKELHHECQDWAETPADVDVQVLQTVAKPTSKQLSLRVSPLPHGRGSHWQVSHACRIWVRTS